MSPLRRPATRRTAASDRSRDLRWGLAALCLAVVLIVGIGIVYVAGTSHESTYTADLSSAGAVRVGDDVRLAGIPVGKVKSLDLQPDRVQMKFTVTSDAFVGDQTALDIRMLTIVGGYYVAVEPAGSKPLGTKVIPKERVTLPYSLMQTFQDAIAPVRKIDGDLLRKNLAALAASVQQSPDSFRAALNAADSLVDIMNKQNADISRTLSFADEYVAALNANTKVLSQLLSTLTGLENLVQNHKFQIAQTLRDLAAILHGVTPLGRAWDNGLKDIAQPLADTIPKLEQLGVKLGDLLDSLKNLEGRLVQYMPPQGGVTVDQSAATIRPGNVCVPVPGGSC